MIKFTIPGEPKAKQRPRLGNGYVYTPTQTVNYENYVKMCFLNNKQEKLTGKIRAEIYAFFGIPASWSKKKKDDAIQGEIRPTKKPDTDNIAKIILDSLNGLAYDDDKQIIELVVCKYYSDSPNVEVTLVGKD
jgi:Holliday junction resolvase RusA-like endonuclease